MLGEVFDRNGTDKGPRCHRYDLAYQRFLPPRDKPIRLLEIGIAAGASLRAWEEWFPNATIHAVDINPAASEHASERSRVFIGNTESREFLQSLVAETGGGWDVVIDDGGHEYAQNVVGFEELWPEVMPGGLYVVEDLHITEHRRRQQTTAYFFGKVHDNILWPRKKRRQYAPMLCFCGEALFIVKP